VGIDLARCRTVSPDLPESGTLKGLSIADAIEAIDPGDEERTAVREVLGHVADDGTVSKEGAEAGLSEASLLVSTVENRTEVASNRLAEVSNTAEQEPDLDVIDRRLSRFENRMAGIREDAEAVGEELESVVERFGETTPLYELGDRLRSLTARARSVQQRADECYVDLDDFETWLDDPQQRRDALHADLDAIAETLSALDADVQRLEGGVLDGSDSDNEELSDPGPTWVDATYRSRVVGLLLNDVREEHAELRKWAEVETSDPDTAPDSGPTVSDRLRSLQAELDRLDDRLSTVAIPDWHGRFENDLEQFEAAIEEMEAPVDWGEVQATLETYREQIESHS
jgi:chromosome segregation ATPase